MMICIGANYTQYRHEAVYEYFEYLTVFVFLSTAHLLYRYIAMLCFAWKLSLPNNFTPITNNTLIILEVAGSCRFLWEAKGFQQTPHLLSCCCWRATRASMLFRMLGIVGNSYDGTLDMQQRGEIRRSLLQTGGAAKRGGSHFSTDSLPMLSKAALEASKGEL